MKLPKLSLFVFGATTLLLTACSGLNNGENIFGGFGSKSVVNNTKYSLPDFNNLTNDQKKDFGMIPVSEKGSNYVTYGLYPQTAVTDTSLANNIEKSGAIHSATGWYYYNNSFYAKAKCYAAKGTVFNNGVTVQTYQDYWFKCEPIRWDLLNTSSSGSLLLSSLILDSQIYYPKTVGTRLINDIYVGPNNYEHSDVRTWLNDNFLKTAFKLDSYYLKTTTVNNGSASTGDSGTNTNAGNNTNDKVFLPSRQELKSSAYGFVNSDSMTNIRCARVTDWAIAQGTLCENENGKASGYGYYWTRSPSGKYVDAVYMVDIDGSIVTININAPEGIRPMVTLLGY